MPLVGEWTNLAMIKCQVLRPFFRYVFSIAFQRYRWRIRIRLIVPHDHRHCAITWSILRNHRQVLSIIGLLAIHYITNWSFLCWNGPRYVSYVFLLVCHDHRRPLDLPRLQHLLLLAEERTFVDQWLVLRCNRINSLQIHLLSLLAVDVTEMAA